MKFPFWPAGKKQWQPCSTSPQYFPGKFAAMSFVILLAFMPGVVFAQSPGVDQMFANFSSSSIALFNLVMRLAMLLGLLIVGKGLLSLKDYSESGGRTQLKTPIMLLAVGILLFSFPTTMTVATQTLALGGFAGTNVMSDIVPDTGMAGVSSAITGVLLFVKLVGVVAAVRGFLVLKAVGEGGQASMGSALTFILGGAAAVNIEATYSILKNSVGWG